MLKDLTRADWLAILGIPENRIPQVLVLRGTRNLKRAYSRYHALFSEVVEVGSPNGLFEDVLIGTYAGHSVGFACVYGAAMAAEITHLFGVLGTRRVIQSGCCGAMGAGILPGDLVCATAAYCGEGAAQYYLPNVQLVPASSRLLERVSLTKPKLVNLHDGPIWTTSALLAEGRSDLERWAALGCLAIDMETAATFAVAEHFGMERISLLFAFDNPLLDAHILATGDEIQARRMAGERALLEITLRLLCINAGCEQTQGKP